MSLPEPLSVSPTLQLLIIILYLPLSVLEFLDKPLTAYVLGF